MWGKIAALVSWSEVVAFSRPLMRSGGEAQCDCEAGSEGSNGASNDEIVTYRVGGPLPSILDDGAWSAFLGEHGATPEAAKGLFRTMEGMNWQAAPEPKKPRLRIP